jgi:glycosyltransferase involved in cell wall biosynthesis
LVSRAASNYSRKRAAIAAIPQLQLVAPSRWLGDIVDRAALTASPAAVIPNGIDLLAFRSPSAQTVAELRERYGLVGKRVVLGVASVWSESKGLPLLCALPPLLGAQYRVVVVGLDERLRRTLPPGVLGLASTASTDELAALYGAADVFVNPSLEETMGMTTVEAMACGTPVVVSNRTAVPEVVPKEGGIVVGEYTPEAFADGVRAAAEGCFTPRSVAERYGNDRMCGSYLELYRAVIRATRAERGK